MFDDWLWQSIPTTLHYLAYVFVLSSIVALTVSTCFYLFRFASQNQVQRAETANDYTWWRLFFPALALSLIGGMSGQLGGGSREGVVGELIPALFVLIGGYGAYLLGEKKIERPLMVPNGLSFVFAFFLLYNMAAVWRQEAEIKEFCLTVFSDPNFDTRTLIDYRSVKFGEYCKLLGN